MVLIVPAVARGEGAAQGKPDTGPPKPAELVDRVKASIDRGLHWLRAQQADDGSYGRYPALTALATLAFVNSHRRYSEADGPFVRRAVEYLLARQKPDGGIYDKDLPTYNTAVALMALAAVDAKRHAEAIAKAQKFLVSEQAAEAAGYRKEDKYYGGIGYGGDERPDLSNLQFALEALKRSGFPADDPAWERARAFLTRCQNLSETNDQKWATNDGGFTYAPGDSPFGGTKSYGAMSYAGLKSLIYADVKRDDPRVQAAVKWARENYTLDEHPGAGQVSLFYYFNVFGKALSTWGEQFLVDGKGAKRDWYADLAERVMSLQREDGSWVNPEPKYWEGNPLVASAWALFALESGLGQERK
jgi:squalene-hopene/tetraprenyl-beta-curcumene cyclase